MATIQQTEIFKSIFLNENMYFDLNFTEICSQGPIDNKSAAAQLTAWRDRPLREPMPPQFVYTYMQH